VENLIAWKLSGELGEKGEENTKEEDGDSMDDDDNIEEDGEKSEGKKELASSSDEIAERSGDGLGGSGSFF